MDRVIEIGAARALVADQALWPRVRDFLWDFAPSIHSSWIEEFESLKVGKFEGTNSRTLNPSDSQTFKLSNSHTFKRFILSALGIEPCFHAFPKDDWSRLALLDGQTLESIIKWLGALACADALRRMTDGNTVRELKASLPGIYPEVFAYTAYFAKIDFQRSDAEKQSGEVQDDGSRPSVVEEVVSTGMSIVELLLDEVPSPLVSRLRFKLPKGLCNSTSSRFKKETCGAVVAKLLKLKFPEAYRLCC